MKSILVVDDNQDICAILKRRFEANGFSVQCVNGGLSLLRCLKDEAEPQALVLDMVLPGRSGIDLLYSVRSKWKDVKVFIFSAYDKYEREESIQVYINGFFCKGDGVNNLIEAIKKEISI